MLQVDGPIYELPGGKIATAFGLERREEYAKFPLRTAADTTTALPGRNNVNAYFAEVNVPVFGGVAGGGRGGVVAAAAGAGPATQRSEDQPNRHRGQGRRRYAVPDRVLPTQLS